MESLHVLFINLACKRTNLSSKKDDKGESIIYSYCGNSRENDPFTNKVKQIPKKNLKVSKNSPRNSIESSFKDSIMKTNIDIHTNLNKEQIKKNKTNINVFKFKHKDLEPFEINNVKI